MFLKIFNFSFMLFLISCSAKLDQCEGGNCVPIKNCTVSADCEKSTCKESVCERNICVTTNKINNESCGTNQVCYDGTCTYASGRCETNQDCDDANLCTNNICSNGTCLISNLNNGESCGDGNRVCTNGFCSSSCYTNDECNDSNECTTETCNNLYSLEVPSVLSIHSHGSNWWVLHSNNKVGKYDASFNYLNQVYTIASNARDLFFDGTFWWVISLDSKVYKYDSNWQDLSSPINLGTPYTTLNSIYLDGEFWYLASSKNNGTIFKFNKDWTYTNISFNINISLKKIIKDAGGTWYAIGSSTPTNTKIMKFSNNWEKLDEFSMPELYQSQFFRSIYLDGDTINAVINNGNLNCLVYKFNTSFNVKSYCEYNKKEDATTCSEGFCNYGMCSQCSNDSHCDDAKICTDDKCSFGTCSSTNKEEGFSCGTDKHCFTGDCLSGCISDADCPTDLFCKDYYCDDSEHSCKSLAKHVGEYCGGTTFTREKTPIFVCNESANCVFDPKAVGLCNEPVTGSGSVNPSFLIYFNPTELTNKVNGEIIYAISNKFNDNGVLKCGGAEYLKGAGINIIFANLGKGSNAWENVPGFSFAETFNLFIRTENYVCKVKALYDTVEFPNCTDKWYPLCLAGAIKLRNINDGDIINFNDPNQCTFVGNAPPK